MVTRTHGKQHPPSRRRFTDRIDARSIQPNPCVVPDVVFSLVTPSNNTAASHDEDHGEMERNTTWLEHSHMPDGNVSRCNRAWLQGRQQRRKPARHPVLRSRYPLLLALVGAYEGSNAAERAREARVPVLTAADGGFRKSAGMGATVLGLCIQISFAPGGTRRESGRRGSGNAVVSIRTAPARLCTNADADTNAAYCVRGVVLVGRTRLGSCDWGGLDGQSVD